MAVIQGLGRISRNPDARETRAAKRDDYIRFLHDMKSASPICWSFSVPNVDSIDMMSTFYTLPGIFGDRVFFADVL